jgi:soluble lytic murein transglycosylase-like protein
MKRLLYLIVLALIVLAASTTSLWAGEYVVLGNGFRLHADRHEVAGDAIRIFSGSGVMEMPAATVAGFEQDDQTKPIPVQPPVVSMALPDIPVAQTPADLAGQAAKRYKLPDGFVQGVMKAESGFHPNALSPKGAIGLMQLMPETARQLGVDPHDPHQNADGGAQYLRELLAKYESDPNQVLLALAAYNAGPAAVDKYHGVPPYAETRQYILRVLKNWDKAENK